MTKLPRPVPNLLPTFMMKGKKPDLNSVDWVGAKRAFTERPERPLMDDLAREFGVSSSRLYRACADQGWPLLRAQRLEQALRSSDAAKALLEAAAGEGAVQRATTSLALELIGHLHEVARVAGAGSKLADTTRANTLNTVAFALRNLTGALKDAGIIGFAKSLKSAAGMSDDSNGRWNPQMLASLNVTVQNLVGSAQPMALQPTARSIPGPDEESGAVEVLPAIAEPAPAYEFPSRPAGTPVTVAAAAAAADVI